MPTAETPVDLHRGSLDGEREPPAHVTDPPRYRK
jgi:hypothetical protein